MTTVQLSSTQFSYGVSAPRLRMTVRGRRVLTAFIVVPLLIAIATLALNGGKATASSDSVAPTYVSVQQGESLWQLAEQIAPTTDPRDVVADILSLNGLDSSQIVAGQRLAIPGQYLGASSGK
jgi:LysM repeat protein